MLLRNAAEGILDSVDLKDGHPTLLASLRLRAESANGDLLLFDSIDDRILDGVVETTLDVGHDRTVIDNEGYRFGTDQDTHSRYCAKATCVEGAGV